MGGGGVSLTSDLFFFHTYQVLQASITWKCCTVLPDKLCYASTTIIGDKVYCRIGQTCPPGDEYVVNSYDHTQDKCSTLPPLPVRFFGLGNVDGNLVAVGGLKKADDKPTDGVYTYDGQSRKWRKRIPHMPTARGFPSILSLESAIVVAGGVADDYTHIDAVEVFITDTSQWHKTEPLPTGGSDMSTVVIENMCYIVGGHDCADLDDVFYASLDDLLHSTMLADQMTETVSAWKILPRTPTFNPVGGVLAGNLLAMGGSNTSDGESPNGTIHMYSPSTSSWMYIGNLPCGAEYGIGVAMLSHTELLVIGGAPKVNTIFKGTLHLKL